MSLTDKNALLVRRFTYDSCNFSLTNDQFGCNIQYKVQVTHLLIKRKSSIVTDGALFLSCPHFWVLFVFPKVGVFCVLVVTMRRSKFSQVKLRHGQTNIDSFSNGPYHGREGFYQFISARSKGCKVLDDGSICFNSMMQISPEGVLSKRSFGQERREFLAKRS